MDLSDRRAVANRRRVAADVVVLGSAGDASGPATEKRAPEYRRSRHFKINRTRSHKATRIRAVEPVR